MKPPAPQTTTLSLAMLFLPTALHRAVSPSTKNREFPRTNEPEKICATRSIHHYETALIAVKFRPIRRTGDCEDRKSSGVVQRAYSQLFRFGKMANRWSAVAPFS